MHTPSRQSTENGGGEGGRGGGKLKLVMFVEKCQIKVKPWHRLLSRDFIWFHSALESYRVVRRKLDLKLLRTATPIIISLFCLFIAVSIAESCTEAIANISQVFAKRSHYKNISKRLLFYHLLFSYAPFPSSFFTVYAKFLLAIHATSTCIYHIMCMLNHSH